MHDYAPIYRFGKGLQTRASEDFQAPDEFRTFQNVRVKTGLAKRRKGSAYRAMAGHDRTALNFDPASSETVNVPLDTRVWALGLRWSLKILFKQDDNPVGNEYLLGWAGAGVGPITVRLNSSRNVVVDFWDSTPTLTTLTSSTALTAGTAYPILITRNGATLTLYVANTAEASSTSVSSTLSGRTPTTNLTFAGHNAASYFDGDIDHATLYSSVLANNANGFIRCTDPLADDVLAHYTFEQTANAHVTDWSAWGNTGLGVNTPTTATALCLNPALVNGAAFYKDSTGVGKAALLAGGRFYAVPLT